MDDPPTLPVLTRIPTKALIRSLELPENWENAPVELMDVPVDDNARQYFGMDYPASPYVIKRFLSPRPISEVQPLLYPGSSFCNDIKDDDQVEFRNIFARKGGYKTIRLDAVDTNGEPYVEATIEIPAEEEGGTPNVVKGIVYIMTERQTVAMDADRVVD